MAQLCNFFILLMTTIFICNKMCYLWTEQDGEGGNSQWLCVYQTIQRYMRRRETDGVKYIISRTVNRGLVETQITVTNPSSEQISYSRDSVIRYSENIYCVKLCSLQHLVVVSYLHHFFWWHTGQTVLQTLWISAQLPELGNVSVFSSMTAIACITVTALIRVRMCNDRSAITDSS